ncbi:GNAT family N-acetyltransferase [Patescibacteria group bacterium]|nr:GNAT family N-acetyltransferase [Patescibacteria group bacterium]
MKIRKMKETEIEEVMKIEQQEIYPELTLEKIKDWMKEEGLFTPQCFVAEEGGAIVGFIVLSPYDIRGDELLLELSAIAVKQKTQRQGIGKNLLNTSLVEVRKHWLNAGFKVTGLLIETCTDDKEAIAFYEKVLPFFQKEVFEKTWSDEEGIVFYFTSFLVRS